MKLVEIDDDADDTRQSTDDCSVCGSFGCCDDRSVTNHASKSRTTDLVAVMTGVGKRDQHQIRQD